jgi:hypothetical protein
MSQATLTVQDVARQRNLRIQLCKRCNTVFWTRNNQDSDLREATRATQDNSLRDPPEILRDPQEIMRIWSAIGRVLSSTAQNNSKDTQTDQSIKTIKL